MTGLYSWLMFRFFGSHRLLQAKLVVIVVAVGYMGNV